MSSLDLYFDWVRENCDPDDENVGQCDVCGEPVDRGDLERGGATDTKEGDRFVLRCAECAKAGRPAPPSPVWGQCPHCGEWVDQQCPCADDDPYPF